jgi:pyruvate/2-oxoglutarate dehydrogenase complex dihydrolipoamide dehydrogenase (E3) component
MDEANRTLLANAHPSDWKNPEPHGRYNLVVLGAGTAGLVSAVGAAILGAGVALVERDLMGGDCLNFGCVPSKALIRAARAAQEAGHSSELGVHLASPLRLEFSEAMQRMRKLRAQISFHDSVQRFARLGIDIFLGEAKFTSTRSLEVTGAKLQFSRAIIATGARASRPPIPGLEELGYLTNETLFSLTNCPRSLTVVGAGPIGCEMAQAFRRFGSEVSIVSDSPGLLPREDGEAATILTAQFEREQIRLCLGARVLRAEKSASGKMLIFDRGHGEEKIIAEEILVATGRTPNIEGLDLEKANVRWHEKGVIVNDHLQTTNSNIYAAGDICSKYQFTHAAEALGRVALQNALFFGRKKASDMIIPWCTYTSPEIAHVGMYEQEAMGRGLPVDTITLRLKENDRAILDGDSEGFVRIHANKRNGRILGATLVSSHAGESIGELVLAMHKKMTVQELAAIIHPYPTVAESIKRAGDASMRSRLKPWMRTMLARMFAFRR